MVVAGWFALKLSLYIPLLYISSKPRSLGSMFPSILASSSTVHHSPLHKMSSKSDFNRTLLFFICLFSKGNSNSIAKSSSLNSQQPSTVLDSSVAICPAQEIIDGQVQAHPCSQEAIGLHGTVKSSYPTASINTTNNLRAGARLRTGTGSFGLSVTNGIGTVPSGGLMPGNEAFGTSTTTPPRQSIETASTRLPVSGPLSFSRITSRPLLSISKSTLSIAPRLSYSGSSVSGSGSLSLQSTNSYLTSRRPISNGNNIGSGSNTIATNPSVQSSPSSSTTGFSSTNGPTAILSNSRSGAVQTGRYIPVSRPSGGYLTGASASALVYASGGHKESLGTLNGHTGTTGKPNHHSLPFEAKNSGPSAVSASGHASTVTNSANTAYSVGGFLLTGNIAHDLTIGSSAITPGGPPVVVSSHTFQLPSSESSNLLLSMDQHPRYHYHFH